MSEMDEAADLVGQADAGPNSVMLRISPAVSCRLGWRCCGLFPAAVARCGGG